MKRLIQTIPSTFENVDPNPTSTFEKVDPNSTFELVTSTFDPNPTFDPNSTVESNPNSHSNIVVTSSVVKAKRGRKSKKDLLAALNSTNISAQTNSIQLQINEIDGISNNNSLNTLTDFLNSSNSLGHNQSLITDILSNTEILSNTDILSNTEILSNTNILSNT